MFLNLAREHHDQDAGARFPLAAAEKIDPSYLSRFLRLNNLAPDIIEAIVAGRPIGWAVPNDLSAAYPAGNGACLHKSWVISKHYALNSFNTILSKGRSKALLLHISSQGGSVAQIG